MRLALLLILLAGAPASQPGGMRLVDEAGARGLAFRHDFGASRLHYLAESTGAGTCVADFDGDGDDDAYLVNGGVLDASGGRKREPSRLFLNDAGSFTDVTERSGVGGHGFGMGCVAADVEGDGDIDLLVTNLGADELFLNDGTARFRDGAQQAGVADARWTTGADLADMDGDGDLDLYVGGYVDMPLDGRWCHGPNDLSLICRPFDYQAIPNRLYRNDGVGSAGPRFVDITSTSGAADPRGKSLGVLFQDLNGDARPDLFVANDTTRRTLLINLGAGVFEDRTLRAGVGLSSRGLPEASMGLDSGDLDGDGLDDLVVTNFQGETNTIYRGLGAGRWADVTDSSGEGAPSLPMLAFGTHFADFDLDGDLDLLVVNGHVDDQVQLYDKTTSFEQRDQLFENVSSPGRVRFVERVDAIAAPLRAGRGSAVLDADGDGDIDVLVNELGAPATLLINRTPRNGRHWIEVELAGGPAGNPRAVGALVEIEAGGRAQQRRIRCASSYLSSSPARASFGLGSATRARVRITWPDGTRQDAGALEADRRHVLRCVKPAGTR